MPLRDIVKRGLLEEEVGEERREKERREGRKRGEKRGREGRMRLEIGYFDSPLRGRTYETDRSGEFIALSLASPDTSH